MPFGNLERCPDDLWARHGLVDLLVLYPFGRVHRTDASHTFASHADLMRKASTASGRERRRQNVPTHMPGWSTMLPTIAAFLRTTIRPGLTIGKLFVELTYFAVLLYAGLYKSNPLTQPVRTGFVAVSQIPIVVALGTKHNVVGMMIGFGYERVSRTAIYDFRWVLIATVLFPSVELPPPFCWQVARLGRQYPRYRLL